jgi:PadR family transcriptional regulator, regulatory protein AphA
MTDKIELTPTSHIVLGLLSMSGQATPYDLKQMAARTVGEFWTLPHSQLYSEPARLARAGYLTEQQEPHGRRRKLYSLTPRGQAALTDWLQTFTLEPYMLRDPALLKLFFGADLHKLAEVQLETHRQKLTDYEALRGQIPKEAPIGPRLALELGIRHERETVNFWGEQARTDKKKSRRA